MYKRQWGIMRYIYADDLIKVMKCTPHGSTTRGKRKKRENPTTDAVQRKNQRVRAENLQMLIMLNFKHGYMVVLNYDQGSRPRTWIDADTRMRKVLKRVKRTDGAFKYIATTERGASEKHYHHHVIVDSLDSARALCRAWDGWTRHKRLYQNGNAFWSLANYLTKQDTKEEKPKGYQSYHASKDLLRPTASEPILLNEPWKDNPEPPEGYEILHGSLRNGFNEYRGIKYQSYMLNRKIDPSERQIDHAKKKLESIRANNIFNPRPIIKHIDKAVDGLGTIATAAVIGVKTGLLSGIRAAADYLNKEPCATSHKTAEGKRKKRTATRARKRELFKNLHRE